MNRRGGRQLVNIGPPRGAPAGYEELAGRIQAFPRQRTYLLPALTTVQHELGWIPDWAVELIGAHLRVPKSEAYGVASSFPELVLTEPKEHVLRICQGAACRAAGAGDLKRSAAGFDGDVHDAECLFICALAPAAQLDGKLVGRATPEKLRV